MLALALACDVTAEGPMLLAFQADWCNQCPRMYPVWDALEQKGYNVVRINVDKSSKDEHYGVRAVPTTICLKSGVEVGREVGYASVARIERHLRR